MAGAGSDEPRRVEPQDDVEDDFYAAPTLAPDGDRIAFVRKAGEAFDVWSMGIDGCDPKRLTRSGNAAEPAWSPDGERIAFVTESGSARGSIRLVSASGGRSRRIRTGLSGVWSPEWSPNGRRIAFIGANPGRGADLYTIKTDGTRRKRLTRSANREMDPAWSPDGKKIAFIRFDPVLAEKPYVVSRAHGVSRVELEDCDDECYVFGLAWSPSGALAASLWREEAFGGYVVAREPDGTQTDVIDWGSVIAQLDWD